MSGLPAGTPSGLSCSESFWDKTGPHRGAKEDRGLVKAAVCPGPVHHDACMRVPLCAMTVTGCLFPSHRGLVLWGQGCGGGGTACNREPT